MKIYGLVGKSLKHSFSPDYFNNKFRKKNIKAEYRLFELDAIDNLREIVEHTPELAGLNVTVPYKQSVVPFLDKLDPVSLLTGSVNTIKIIRKRNKIILKGFNTDAPAFEASLKPLIKKRDNLKALVLGTGGTAHSVAYVLRKLGVYFYFVSRKPVKVESLRYSWLDEELMEKYKLIINTTPVGMYPDVDKCPEIRYDLLDKENIVYDVIYNPQETLFLKNAKEKGAVTKNGLEMLHRQADLSWKIWNSIFY